MRYLLALLLLLLPTLAWAEYSSPQSKAELVSSVEAVKPGEGFTLTLAIQLAPGWHTYTDPPGDAGMATRVKFTLPPGFTASGIQWPPHEVFKEGELTTYGYKDAVDLPIPILPPAALNTSNVPVTAEAEWLVCKEICIPERHVFTLSLPVEGVKTDASLSVLPLLLAALLGGLLLNLMPCVLPVLSLKALALARTRDVSPAYARREGIAYTAGVLSCFLLLAGVLLLLKEGGAALGWGYQMQSPLFISAMALLLFAVGLNLSGVFSLPVLSRGKGEGSFMTGLLAALVATPCTAPFMAAAVGAALTQSAGVALLVFAFLGFGMALPFLLLSLFPTARHWLPKPGEWMEKLKHWLALPMYLSSIWLIWVLALQAGADAVALTLIAAVCLAFSLRYLRLLLPLAFIPLLWVMEPAEKSTAVHPGEAFSTQRIEELRAQGKGVLVDATAAWCITCQVNYQTTLGTESTKALLLERGITYMVADWTRADPAITAFLASFDRRGVPLYVYYPPQGEPRVLPQVLTPSIVEESTR